jgi:glycerol-3-phosphate dehydrogenase
LPFVLPLTPFVPAGQAWLARAGFAAGDALRVAAGTPRAALPRSRRVGAVEVRRLTPAVRREGLRGGLVQWDGQLIDDARLVVALARTAAGFGARILTRCAVSELHGRGASVVDTLTGTPCSVRARAVVNATGVWAGSLDPQIRLRPSRGTHVVLRAAALGHPAAAMTIPVPGEPSRFVFALPQPDGLVYAGLTDEPVSGPIADVPAPHPAEIGFLLDVLGTALDVAPGPSDVVGSFAGLRPLLAGSASRTSDLSRRHAVHTSPSGVTTVVGGKLTTYRRMAADAVDAALLSASLPAGRCRTTRLPLVGAASPARLARIPAPARLVARYGAEAPAIAEDPALLRPVAPGVPVTPAEFLFAVRHEGALDEDDLLDRRTRIGLVPADREAALPAARQAVAAA